MYANVAPRVEIRNINIKGTLNFTVISKIPTLNINIIVNGNLRRTSIRRYSTPICCSLNLSLNNIATPKKYNVRKTILNIPSNIVIITHLDVTVVDSKIIVLGFTAIIIWMEQIILPKAKRMNPLVSINCVSISVPGNF